MFFEFTGGSKRPPVAPERKFSRLRRSATGSLSGPVQLVCLQGRIDRAFVMEGVVVAGAVLGGGEDGLQIERHVRIAVGQRDRDGGPRVGQRPRVDLSLRPAFHSRHKRKVVSRRMRLDRRPPFAAVQNRRMDAPPDRF